MARRAEHHHAGRREGQRIARADSPREGDNSTFLIALNLVVPAPIPSASVSIAKNENPGGPRIPRMPYRKSCHSDCMETQTPAGNEGFPLFAAGMAWWEWEAW